jgi:hypothetical protein
MQAIAPAAIHVAVSDGQAPMAYMHMQPSNLADKVKTASKVGKQNG